MTLTDLSRATWTTFFILKRIGNWKTSSFSFSKRATFTFQNAIIRLILKKIILSWNQKWFHQIESQFFWNHCGFTRYFEFLGGIFFLLGFDVETKSQKKIPPKSLKLSWNLKWFNKNWLSISWNHFWFHDNMIFFKISLVISV